MAATTKVWRSSRTSKAAMTISEDQGAIVSGDNIVAVNKNGITLSGPISITADAMNIRKGALFVGLNDFMSMIPSTLITPFPQQIPMPPIGGIINLTRDVVFFMSLLS